MDVGVGLWTGQSTALAPMHHSEAYRQVLEDARVAEDCGFDSFWMSEHHFYYDGYCPSLLTVAGAVLEQTERISFGTGVMLLPYQNKDRVTNTVTDLERRHPGRLDLGLSIGYREVEFDGKAVSRKTRLRRHLEAVDQIASQDAVPRIWMGAQAEKSVYRAGSKGLGLFLPGSMSVSHIVDLRKILLEGWESAGRPGGQPPRVAALRNFWICDSAEERLAAESWLRSSYVLYQGLGYAVAATDNAGSIDFAASFEAAAEGVVKSSLLGSAEELTEELQALAEVGVDKVVLRLNLEGAPQNAVQSTMRRTAERVLPALKGATIA